MEHKEDHHDDMIYCPPFQHRHTKAGKVMGGLIVVAVGALLLMKKTGVIFPEWLFSWQSLVIVIGLYIGARHSFKRGGWWVVTLVGVVFLIDEYIQNIAIGDYLWPVLIIAAGIIMIFKPRRKWDPERWKEKWHHHHGKHKWNFNDAQYRTGQEANADDYIDSVSILGGIKKNVISKEFKGGDVVCVFGGSEINLTQADFNGKVVLEVTQIFGGTKLIVPPHWEVVTEMVAILGGIEDKRPPYTDKVVDGSKILVVRGTSIFGGIDIKSY